MDWKKKKKKKKSHYNSRVSLHEAPTKKYTLVKFCFFQTHFLKISRAISLFPELLNFLDFHFMFLGENSTRRWNSTFTQSKIGDVVIFLKYLTARVAIDVMFMFNRCLWDYVFFRIFANSEKIFWDRGLHIFLLPRRFQKSKRE